MTLSLVYSKKPAVVKPVQTLSRREYSQIHLDGLKHRLKGCTSCSMKCHRRQVVFGGGAADAILMVVFAHPNWFQDRAGHILPATQDRRGVKQPIEGTQKLTEQLLRIGLTFDDVYITSTIMCGPPPKSSDGSGREPVPSDAWEKCIPHLLEKIKLVNPAGVILLGRDPTNQVLLDPRPMVQFQGHRRQYIFPGCKPHGPDALTQFIVSTHNPYGLSFAGREEQNAQFKRSWDDIAQLLDGFGRAWRPGASIFRRGWVPPQEVKPEKIKEEVQEMFVDGEYGEAL